MCEGRYSGDADCGGTEAVCGVGAGSAPHLGRLKIKK